MKKIILLFAALCPLAALAQGGHFVLKANVSGLKKPVTAYLYYFESGKSRLDSVKSATGNFEFSGDISGICSGRLTLDHTGVGLFKLGAKRDALPVLLEKGEIKVSAVDSISKGIFTGSAINDQNGLYLKTMSSTDKAIDALIAKSEAATPEQRKDQQFQKTMHLGFKSLAAEQEALQLKFITQHPDFYISYLTLVDVAGPIIDVDKIEPLYNKLSPNIRNSREALEFGKLIAMAKVTAVGTMAPDFTQNDTNDQPVKLSDFRGKYVLLDFWASWCGPCRAENPNVVKAYHQFKAKNFTVLSVSLDQPGKKDAWLAAIKADGLEWTQVSDLKFWNNAAAKQYGIRAIPQNFLIDPTGKIIGKNLTGEDLNKKLKEIFGS
ncbi:TlpA disulfide reductase family protein [Mucilaginibacter polytrichastri]|nr:TlpA disulfide reductase family protein [Mucilaginibacter polytrichastri]SFS85889.1 Peroxiredoxin [Mucilaginibacter polytrichastri]